MSALVIGKNMDNVENSEFSTFCGKLVAERNRLAVRNEELGVRSYAQRRLKANRQRRMTFL